MKTTSTRITAVRATALTLALAFLPGISALAQTSVPTPRSVAPAYQPPVSSASDQASSQSAPRYVAPHAGTWDFYLTIGGMFLDNTKMNASHVWLGRDTVTGQNVYADGTVKINYDDAVSFGFGLGCNITEQLSIHGQIAYASPDYDATFTVPGDPDSPYRVWGEAAISTGDLAVRYDLTRGKLRPFVQASVGFLNIDTGIRNGPNYYWWDYYWGGYYVDSPTVSHTYLTLGATAGLSYTFTRNFFGMVSYTANWADTPHDWTLNQRVNFSLGWNY